MQNPPELITEFIKQWQNGSKIVLGVQKQNNENKLLTLFKSAYYNFMAAICGHIPYMTDFGLFDKSFINILRQIPDPYPYLRGIICDYGFGIKKVYYSKNKRKKGVGMALYTLYDFAMLGITSCTKVIVRAAVWLGLVSAAAGLFRLLVFGVGIYPFVLMLFGVLLFFIGFVGEYVVQINRRLQNHPRVIEDRRINYGN